MLDRRSLGIVLLLGLVATVIAGAVHRWSPSPVRSPAFGEPRIISLSPAITETLFALDAGSQVVGRSNFCNLPKVVGALPSVGTGLTPSFEPIARLQPTQIITEASATSKVDGLEEIAPTTALPWLTLEEVAGSVRRLGSLVGREVSAEALARSLVSTLSVEPPSHGPRALLLMGTGGPDEATLFYVKATSLHGRAMHAAGLRNAIPDPTGGAPTLSLERLLEVDPDVILTMVPIDDLTPDARREIASRFHKLTRLRAVRNQNVGVLAGSQYFSTGPTVLALVQALRDEVRRLKVAPQGAP